MHRHANIAVCFPRNAVFTTKLNYDVNVVDSARVAHVREGRVLGVSRATAYSTNASRGLSAIAEFLMFSKWQQNDNFILATSEVYVHVIIN